MKDSIIIGEHDHDCPIHKLENNSEVPNCWNVWELRRVPYCDENGNELGKEKVAEIGHAELWYEMRCGNVTCNIVKRVRAKAIANID